MSSVHSSDLTGVHAHDHSQLFKGLHHRTISFSRSRPPSSPIKSHTPPQLTKTIIHPPPHRAQASMPPPSTVPDHSRKRKAASAVQLYPSASPSPTPEADDEDVEYTPAPAKRVAKASSKGNGRGGMSREQLRKANHSLIERRRREKINAALAELREMVPGLSGESKGGEFKLEVGTMAAEEAGMRADCQVLERTVEYMRELKSHLAQLETQPGARASRNSVECPITNQSSSDTDHPMSSHMEHTAHVSSRTPPSPSTSHDPNETEAESNLPPPYTFASRSPSIATLIHTANETKAQAPPPHRRPRAGSGGTRAGSGSNLYLPFPTPSPTSPFLSYNASSMSHVGSSSSSSGIEPSPFIAPLQNISLFGGALNLDSDKGERYDRADRGHDLTKPSSNAKLMPAEEAANLLLAFSSPDAMRPTMGTGSGMTPRMSPAAQEQMDVNRARRNTCDSDEFVLDGGVRSAGEGDNVVRRVVVVGKTAKDILQMK